MGDLGRALHDRPDGSACRGCGPDRGVGRDRRGVQPFPPRLGDLPRERRTRGHRPGGGAARRGGVRCAPGRRADQRRRRPDDRRGRSRAGLRPRLRPGPRRRPARSARRSGARLVATGVGRRAADVACAARRLAGPGRHGQGAGRRPHRGAGGRRRRLRGAREPRRRRRDRRRAAAGRAGRSACPTTTRTRSPP